MSKMSDNNITCEGAATSATIEKFSRICRACLSEHNLKPIFGTTIDNLDVDHLLSHLVSIKIEKNDFLPSNICSTCIEELHRIHKFRKQCHTNEVILKNLQLKSQETELERRVESKLCNFTETDKNVDDLLSNNNASVSCNDDKHGEVTYKLEELSTAHDNLWPQAKSSNVLYKDDIPNRKTIDIKQPDILGDIILYSLKTETIPDVACQETFTFESDHKSPHVCNICGQKFVQEEPLLHHKKEHELAKQTVLELDEKPSCQFCGQSFTHTTSCRMKRMGRRDESPHLGKKRIYKSRFSQHSKDNEKRSQKDHNSKEVDEGQFYICYHCEKCFGNKEYLKRHLQCHGRRRFLCSVCGAECISTYKLRMHARIHTGERPHVCSVCKKSFTHFTTLTRHKRIHTGQKPYNCEFCGRQFTQRTHLNKHLRLHTGERPYACNLCEKVFIDNASLTIHVRLHTGDRCFVCTICGKGYYTKSTKRKHMKQVHKVKEEMESSSGPSQVAALS